jgi:hypothetical protein
MTSFNGYLVRPSAVYRVLMGWRCEASLTEDEMSAIDEGYDPRIAKKAAQELRIAKAAAARKRRDDKRAKKAAEQRNARHVGYKPKSKISSTFNVSKAT